MTLLLVLLSSAGTYGQMRQMVWPLPLVWATVSPVLVGSNSYVPKLMLDFHSEPPTLGKLPHDTVYGPHEAISSICNRWGQLQFYSDNHRVWNGSHNLIDNIDYMHNYIPESRSVFSTAANATKRWEKEGYFRFLKSSIRFLC